jgi:hypothetical protein
VLTLLANSQKRHPGILWEHNGASWRFHRW